MNQTHAFLVQKSYGRCSKSDGSYNDFYDEFLGSSNEIREHFANTSRAKQKVFIHNGLSTILLFAMGSAKSEEQLEALVAKYGAQGLNIAPDLYPLWVEALLSTASKHDSEFSPELAQAWTDAVQMGIDKFVPGA